MNINLTFSRLSFLFRDRQLRWLVWAALFHLSASLAIYFVGKNRFSPGVFDQNGIAVKFAGDGVVYYRAIVEQAELLRQSAFAEWWNASVGLHIKLYSVSFVMFAPLVGDNLLAVEPLNLFYYSLIIALIGVLTKLLFGKAAAMIAAAFVALFPSLLLHTLQPLREGLFIAALLLIVTVQTAWLTRICTVSQSATLGLLGVSGGVVMWKTRGNFWEVVLCVVIVGFVALLIEFVKQRRVFINNSVGAAVLLLSAGLIPFVVQPEQRHQVAMVAPSAANSQETSPMPVAPVDNAAGQRVSATTRIVRLRKHFYRRYAAAGSNFDQDVVLSSVGDLLFYAPRALLFGLCAPFPGLWFESGKEVGASGRLLAGTETLLMYVLQIFALITVWRHRKKTAVWFLLVTILIGCLAFGLVVVNVAALYRMRYVFWLLTIVLASDSIVKLRIDKSPSQASAVIRT